MRFSIKLSLTLAFTVIIVALISFPLVGRVTQKWFIRDLEIRSRLISNLLNGEIRSLSSEKSLSASSKLRLKNYLDRLANDERIFALVVCSENNEIISASSSFKNFSTCADITAHTSKNSIIETPKGPLHVFRAEMTSLAGERMTAALYHDMSFITHRSDETKHAFFLFFFGLLVLVSSLSLLIAHLSLKGWTKSVRDLVRVPKMGRARMTRVFPDLQPLAKDLREWAREMSRTGEERDPLQLSWSPEALRSVLHKELAGEEVFVVSNREPYIHSRKEGGEIQVQVPASGLVTALEPIMRACAGTWIAHGSGNADREVVDKNDRVAVPPDEPSYHLRRVWLTEEEEKGYYYGFANEGLWPLCHIAHTRPTFRTDDFELYKKVNRLFADAVVKEAKTKNPVVLIQDYHFALLPRMIRDLLPDATIITFWHIPWPNSEAFGICPWREELLEGMLGSSILGFHTRFHCHNFLESVDRYLESRIEKETMNVSFGGETTQVAAYPISIDWPPRKLKHVAKAEICRIRVRERHGFLPSTRLAIGVDRLDYTKGILERFNGVERFLELHPEFRGKFCLIQIGAPTRSNILQYKQFVEQVNFEAKRINAKFVSTEIGMAPPILLLDRHHEPEEVFEYFRASDICLVTSLHDGMNLVAKEFIGARDDEDGVLILSQFAGASKELLESIVVNPYDVDQCADAIYTALRMPPEERRIRMRSMRSFVQEFNVYRWAGRMLLDAAKNRKLAKLRKKHPSLAKLP